MIVGLSGYASSGKDTLAKYFVEQGWERIAFADKLKEFLYALNPTVRFAYDIGEGQVGFKVINIQNLVNEIGWDKAKQERNVRALLQRLGTEAGREILGKNVWVDAALKDCDPSKNYIITDCRFENEAQAIIDLGGRVWRINRPGVGPATASDGTIHSSETALDNWKFDRYVYNLPGEGHLKKIVEMEISK